MLTISLNIIKGLFKKVRSNNNRFERISWTRKKWLKHEEDQDLKTYKISNLTIQYKRSHELLHSYEDIFINEIYRFKSDKQNPIILDCGSNIGLAALYFKSIYPMSELHCFEPDPNNFSLLKINISKNNCINFHLHQKAIWKDNNGIPFIAMSSEGSRIAEEGIEQNLIMDTQCFSELLNQFEKIDLLKLDIEGAEKTVLLEEGISFHNVDNLFIEYHGKADETVKLRKIIQLVENSGFKVYIKMAADHLSSPFYHKSTGYSYDVQLNIFCYK
jgi:FkbM family methyltransferase